MPLPIVAAGLLAPVVATAGKFLVGYVIVRIITIFGIALVSYGAVDALAGQIKTYLTANLSGLGGDFAVYASALGIFDAVNVISSAYIAAVSVRVVMGTYNRMTFGKK